MKMWCGCSRVVVDGEELDICARREMPWRQRYRPIHTYTVHTHPHTHTQRSSYNFYVYTQCLCVCVSMLSFKIKYLYWESKRGAIRPGWLAGRGDVRFSLCLLGIKDECERTLAPPRHDLCAWIMWVSLSVCVCPLTASIVVIFDHSPSNRLNVELTEVINKQIILPPKNPHSR